LRSGLASGQDRNVPPLLGQFTNGSTTDTGAATGDDSNAYSILHFRSS